MEKIDQPMRVLITGGFGYVGGRIAQYLAECGHQIVLGSREKQSKPEWLNHAEVVQLQWDDEDALAVACKNVNVVIHSAGMNAQDCAADPVAALEFNGLTTARLVRASQKAGVTKFIYLSTAHVYRSPLVGKINEDTCPRNLHPYATSHLAGENAVLYSSGIEADFTGVVLRLSNVVGAPTSNSTNCWTLFVNNICREAIESNSITIRNNPDDVRDFVSMSTVCMVCSYLIDDLESKISYIYNIGSGKSQSLLQMATFIKERYQKLNNISLELILPKKNNKVENNLYYIPSKLPFKTYGDVDTSLSSEIDRLIRYCDIRFG